MDVIQLGSVVVDLDKPLGEGGFGTVFEGFDQSLNSKVAVKQMKVSGDDRAQVATAEIKNLFKLSDHDHIVKFLDFHFAKNSFWLVIEYCSAGSLDHFFNEHRPVPLPNKIEFMYQIVDAVNHLHNQKPLIVHRDLKPQNILLHYNSSGKAIVKLTDFGLSKIAPQQAQAMKSLHAAQFSTKAGTPVFMAPELFADKGKYTASVDIFSMGLVFLVMFQHDDNPDMIPYQVKGCIPMPVGMLMTVNTKVELVTMESTDPDTVRDLKLLIKEAVSKEPLARPTPTKIRESLKKLMVAAVPTDALAEKLEPLAVPRKDIRGVGKPKEEQDKGSSGLDHILELLYQLVDIGTKSDSSDDEILKGDKVKVESDAGKAIKLQENHGGWNNAMRSALGKVGVVVDKVRHVFKVQCLDGKTWSFNPKLLTKVDEKGRAVAIKSSFKRYDIVQIVDDEDELKSLQKGHGGWNNKMRFALGGKGIVNKVDSDGDVLVECINTDSWTVNPAVLKKIDLGRNFEKGDKILISADTDKVRKLQSGHGGWHADMEKHLGTTGTIQQVMEDKDVIVRKGGPEDVFVYNSEVLTLVAKKDEIIEAIAARKHTKFTEADNNADVDGFHGEQKFERYDVVKIAEDETLVKFLQAEKGIEWDKKMRCVLGVTGIVRVIDEAGNIHVECINMLKFTFTPAVLVKHTTSGNVDIGSLVMIPSDFELVKILQEGVGVWEGEMAESLGHVGTIKSILGDGKLKIEVMMGRGNQDPVWTFCANAVTLVATRDEIIQALRRKQAAETLE